MKLIKKILERLNGLHYRQEYLCFPISSLDHPLHIFVDEDKKDLYDITRKHCFVGYSPLVFALHSLAANPGTTIRLLFNQSTSTQNVPIDQKAAPAKLTLKKIRELQTNEGRIYFYEGIEGHHRFVNSFHKNIIRLTNAWYGKKPGNVFLAGNLLEQVQIAYAIPRKICLVTVGQNHVFNLFPTDLHGPVGERHYLISLRHEGRACEQVEAAGRIVLSDMHADFYQEIFRLGKNHMQPMKDLGSFAFDPDTSKNYNLPLPKGMVSYRELELLSGFIQGIHKILLFRINYAEGVGDEAAALFHVHNVYATWRSKKGLAGNYLLR